MSQAAMAPDGDAFPDDDDAALADGQTSPLHDSKIIDNIVEQIAANSQEWLRPTVPLVIGRQRWLPDLVRDGNTGLLHVHISASMPGYIVRRLRVAATTHRIYIALPIEALYDETLLRILADVDAEVIVVDGDAKLQPAYYLATLADYSVPIAPDLRRMMARQCWGNLNHGTNFEKGRHFEGLLAFLLSQVEGFSIFSRNFYAATDEIDIIVRVTSISKSCWSESGVPFVIVEAKNRKEKAGAPTVSLLIRKLQTRRGRAKIGILFSKSGFSSDARDEELKEAQGNYCVAMLGPSEIEAWINNDNLTSYLDSFIAKAMLR